MAPKVDWTPIHLTKNTNLGTHHTVTSLPRKMDRRNYKQDSHRNTVDGTSTAAQREHDYVSPAVGFSLLNIRSRPTDGNYRFILFYKKLKPLSTNKKHLPCILQNLNNIWSHFSPSEINEIIIKAHFWLVRTGFR